MRILVTGANGQLGKCLSDLVAQEKDLQVIFTDVTPGAEYLDITDAEAVRAAVERYGIEAIVNCAGYTNVEKAEEEPELAEKLNAKAVANLAVAMKEVDGLLIHISTDYIFGGESVNTPYTEDHPAAPLGVYAATKWHGEEAVYGSGVRYVIFRTAWLYSEYGKNFVKTMLRLTAEKPSLKVVFDQVGTPTYAGDLAKAILTVLKDTAAPKDAVYNYTNEGVCSWYDFAKMIAEYAGHTSCDIQPCHSHEFPSKVHRPSYSVLDKSKVKEALGIRIPHWTESLRLCLKHLQ